MNKLVQRAFQRFGMGGLFTPTCTSAIALPIEKHIGILKQK
ncbi:MAG: hypothetical protein V7K98_13325 [Nostoc sp.]